MPAPCVASPLTAIALDGSRETAAISPTLRPVRLSRNHGEAASALCRRRLAHQLRTLGTTLGSHPLALLRRQLRAQRCRSSRELANVESGRPVSVAGLVIGRQRSQTASVVIFVTLKDEFGLVNGWSGAIWPNVSGGVLVQSQMLRIDGRLEVADGVRHVIVGRLTDLTPLLTGLDVRSRDFHRDRYQAKN